MEVVGIALWIAGGVVAAPIFCFVLAKFILPRRSLANLLLCGSVLGLALFVIDLLAVSLFGAIEVRRVVGPAYFPIHALATLLSAASLAGTLLLGHRNFARRWFIVAAVCWVVGVFSIFFQYGVAETLYGIDGVGGPYNESES